MAIYYIIYRAPNEHSDNRVVVAIDPNMRKIMATYAYLKNSGSIPAFISVEETRTDTESGLVTDRKVIAEGWTHA